MKVVKHFSILLLFENMAKPAAASIQSKNSPNTDTAEKLHTFTATVRYGKINHLPQWPDRPKRQYYEQANR